MSTANNRVGGGVSNQVIHLNSKNTLTAQFAKWIYEYTKEGKLASKLQCAKTISRLKEGEEVNELDVTRYISLARIYCEGNLNCSLWNVRGEGWRVGTKFETAMTYVQCARKTIAWAYRTQNLSTIVERKYIPEAIKAVLSKAESGINKTANSRQSYVEAVTKYLLEKKKEEGENEKILELPAKK